MIKLFGYCLLKDNELKELEKKAEENKNKMIKIYEWMYNSFIRFQNYAGYPYAENPPSLDAANEWAKWIAEKKKQCIQRIAELKNCKVEEVEVREME